MKKRSLWWLLAAFLPFALHFPAMGQDAWEITDSIPLDAIVVDLVKDPNRPILYALNRTDSKVLFIDLELKTIKELYVGKLPTSLAISEGGDKLYVANVGIGSGTPGGYQIAVVDLETQAKTHHFLTTYQPVNLAVGSGQRLFYNNGSWEDGNIDNAGGYGGVIDLATETDSATIGGFRIKSHMVVNAAKTKLYGQYVYSGNLGEMGVFDIENTTIFKLDRHPYSPYPYGWDYNNYTISQDGKRLAFGHVLFNANNLLIQYGVFPELVYALNGNGTVAFGKNKVWDTATFATEGDATPLLSHGLSTSLARFDVSGNCAYVFSTVDFSIKKLQPASGSLPPVDTDTDGLDLDEEIANHTDPTNWDSDGDGLDDGSEVLNGLDPLVPNAKTPEMRALMATLLRNPGQLNVGAPIVWEEYGYINVRVQLEGGPGLEDMAPLESPAVYRFPVIDLGPRHFFRIAAD